MSKQPLRLVDSEEPTKADVYMAKIHQSWREWIGYSGGSWHPVENLQKSPALDVDEILKPKLVLTESKIPWYDRLKRKIQRMLNWWR